MDPRGVKEAREVRAARKSEVGTQMRSPSATLGGDSAYRRLLEGRVDDYGYPTEETLELISKWRPSNEVGERGWVDLLETVRGLWAYREWGWSQENGLDGIRRYSISTAGWSGNESLIDALYRNKLFWAMCWAASRRGGHHLFEVRLTRGVAELSDAPVYNPVGADPGKAAPVAGETPAAPTTL